MLKALRKNKNQKGFTLIEILIVVVIVAILAAISVPIYIEYVKSARASDAKTTINAIWQAAQVYYQDRGTYPGSVEELDNEKYLDIATSTGLQWTFSIIGSPPQSISATSTELMRGGAGHTVTYDINQGTWTGYGLPNEGGDEE
jgi:prepilin-type N-terminal cleavage/methylation domain-containing protein